MMPNSIWARSSCKAIVHTVCVSASVPCVV